MENPTRQFVTNVGLITSSGPNGQDIMAAEWTHHVSYSPSLISVHTHSHDATAENISVTKEFGISLAAEDQNIAASVAGGSHGQQVDKIAVLKELGVKFYAGKKINALMVKGAALNVECKVIEQKILGDHIMFVGEVVAIHGHENLKPLLYHGGKYWKVGENIPRPGPDKIEEIKKLIEKHHK